MCFSVKCATCGKSSWQGCGRHVESVYKQIPEGRHCLCKDWPRVKLSQPSEGSTAKAEATTTAPACQKQSPAGVPPTDGHAT